MTLYERASFTPLDDDNELSLISNKRVARWKKNVANDDCSKFNRRLAWDGIDERRALRMLGAVEPAQPYRPHWFSTLMGCLEAIENLCMMKRLSSIEGTSLEDYFRPLCHALARQARRGFDHIENNRIPLLAPTAWDDLSDMLEIRLWSIFRPVLDAEFGIFIHSRQSRLTVRFKDLAGFAHSDYRLFFERVTDDNLASFLEKYSFMMRLVAVTIQEWQEATIEFVTRLWNDWPLIATLADEEGRTPEVNRILGGLADIHHGGRSVLMLTFCAGGKVVYKPKDVHMEQAFSDFLMWLNNTGMYPPLKPLIVIDKRDYGWVEYVSHAECSDVNEARLYFLRSGMLLALCYLLDGTDIHCENLIACGEHPVIVDLETLFHPRYPEDESVIGAAQRVAGRRIWKSVLRTMMLPNWMADHDGKRFNIGGIVGGGAEELRGANIPVLKGRPLSSDAYSEDIEEGFCRVALYFMNNKESLCHAKGPLSSFKGVAVRFILRPTQVYNQLMRRILHPSFLREGVDASIEIDSLASTFVHSEARPSEWAILRSEHDRVLNLNIPFFQTQSDSCDLVLDGSGTLHNYFRSSAFDDVIANISSLTRGEIEEQRQFIRSSFNAFRALPEFASETNQIRHVLASTDADHPAYTCGLTHSRLMEEVVRIADTIIRTRIFANDGSSTWIGMQFLPTLNRYEYQVVDNGLYAGSSGCALFLACMASETGMGIYADASLSAIKTIRVRLRQDLSRYNRLLGLSGFTGAVSVAYVMLQMGKLLDDKAMITEARQVLMAIDLAGIRADRQIDVMLGTAGSLLVLLSAADSACEKIIENATVCGDHLLESLPNEPSGDSYWNFYPRTGLSHGAAGVAMALFRLSTVTGEKRFIKGAQHLVEYENNFWNEESRNWIDGDGENRFYGMAWCHGAPGIVLARLNCLGVGDDSVWRKHVDCALDSIATQKISRLDNLCCGSLGRCIVLLEAANITQRQELRDTAWRLARDVLDKARANEGEYDLVAQMPRKVSNPTLMQGLAGIGFGFLSLAGFGTKGRLPDVLTLQ